VEAVEHDRHAWREQLDGLAVGSAHVHRDGLQLGSGLGQAVEERLQAGVVTALDAEQNLAGEHLDDYRGIAVPLADGELVDGDAADIGEAQPLGPAVQVALHDVPDHAPADLQQAGHRGEGHLPGQAEHEPSEGSGVALALVRQATPLLPHALAATAEQDPQPQHQEDGPEANGQAPQCALHPSFAADLRTAALRTAQAAGLRLQVKVHSTAPVLGPEVVVGGSTERVVQQTRGHRGLQGRRFATSLVAPMSSSAHFSLQMNRHGRGHLTTFPYPVPPAGSRRACRFALEARPVADEPRWCGRRHRRHPSRCGHATWGVHSGGTPGRDRRSERLRN